MQDDPFAALEQAAQRSASEELAAKKIGKARVKLVLGKDASSVFFASLTLRLQPVVDWDCETAATDGKRLAYSPEFINQLDPQEVIGLLAHEVMHCAMGHHTRRGHREAQKWNVAADLAINHVLKEAGFSLPQGGLFPGEGKYAALDKGLSAEDYYNQLPEQDEQDGDDPGGCGGVQDAGDPAEQKAAAADWQVATAQAAEAASQRGDLPGALGRLVQQAVEPEVDWKTVLREFLSNTLTAREDYSWSSPNRRFISQGLYLPGLRSPTLGHVVVHVDVSASTEPFLPSFGSELNGVLETNPCRVTVVYGDSQVQKVVEWQPSDGPLNLEAVGGGGTSHAHLWDWLKEQDEEPVCVVCLTDGETNFGTAPNVPVLWTLTQPTDVPFGRAIVMK